MRHGLFLVCLAILAATVAWLCIALTRETGRTAAIWPLNALFLVLIMRAPRRAWPGFLAALFVGNTAANVLVDDPGVRAAMLAGANLVEILVVAGAMTWRRSVRLLRRASLLRFAAAALVGSSISTILAHLALASSNVPLAGHEAAIWFAADLLGLLIYVPLLWIMMSDRARSPAPGERLAMAFDLAVLTLITLVVFAQSSNLGLFFIPPVLMLLAIRRGVSGAAVGMVAVALISTGFTLVDRGPTMLVEGGPQTRILVLQVFLAANVFMTLAVGAALGERGRMIERLTAARRHRSARLSRERLLVRQAGQAERIGRVGYWTVRPGTGETYWSPEVYRIYGVAPETFDPASQDSLSPFVPEDRDRVSAIILRSLETRSGWQFDADLQRPSGEIVRIRSIGEFHLTDTGKIETVFGVIGDITEDHRLLERVREQESLYRLLAENSSDLIARYGPDSVFTYLSPSIEAMLGYKAEDMIGRHVKALIHPDDLDQVYSTWRNGLATGKPFSVQYRAIHRDGSIRWMEARPTVSRDESGEIVDFIDTIRDVSDRHEREKALARAIEAAETAARAKTDFLSRMSHEIRTPLNGVLGFAELLARENLSEGQRHYATRLQSSARSLLSIVNDILDFSKIEAGMMTVEPRPYDPGSLVEEVVELVRAAYPDPDLTVSEAGGPTAQKFYMGDDDRIRQILLNLVGNAAKFTRQGKVEVKWSVRKGRLRVSVTDTGPGIPEDRLATIFDSFSQADASVSRSFGGSGLGLSISRSLARLMQGDVTLKSRLGKGTRARLDLPAPPARGPIPDGTETATARRAGRCARILVVDDVEINRELMEISLGQAGHAVTAVESGEAALAVLREGGLYDLVIMDVQMPGMDGLAATRAIRALTGPVAGVPVVGLSANVLPEQVEACRAAGMDAHMGKPVDSQRLVALIDRTLGRATTPTSAALEASPAYEALRARYLEQLAGVPAEMKALVTGRGAIGRTAALAALAHRIAGTSGSLGFTGLSQSAARLELAAQNGARPAALRPLVDSLVQQIAALKGSAP